MGTGTGWDPGQYNRFAGEREQPFWDLVGLLLPAEGARVVDLGCGDGRLSAALHAHLKAASTLGVDSSPSMLEQAKARADDRLRFAPGDMATWSGADLDIVFSNAALHWVPDHAATLARWSQALRSDGGGQLAVQVPANADHPSHVVARRLAEEWMGSGAPPDPVEGNVLTPERYSEVLEQLGFDRQHVRLQVYGHRLASADDVVEWVKGTSLTRFKAVLSDEDYTSFLDEYRRRLRRALGEQRPYFYAFKRILMWSTRS